MLNGHGKRKFAHADKIKLGDYLNWAIATHLTSNDVFGIKILFEHLEYFQTSDALKELFDNSQLIYLERANKIQQTVSYFLAQKTGVWAHYDKPITTPEEVNYDREVLRNRYMYLTMQDTLWKVFFTENQYSPLVVGYESFIEDVMGTLQRILQHIGVEPADLRIATTMQAQRSSINEEFCTRLTSELKYRLGGGSGTIYTFNGTEFL
jgi:LPS sulfotransferase NodH